MTILYSTFGLAANYFENRIVEFADFIGKLSDVSAPEIVASSHDRESGASSLVILFEGRLDSYNSSSDPDYEFRHAIEEALVRFADWLERQDKAVFDDFKLAGLSVWLFVEMWIDQDQLDIKFPPKLLGECGRLGLALEIVTND